MSDYEKAIGKTLCYAIIFQYVPTKEEIWRYLIWENKYPPKFSEFSDAFELLLKKKKIKKRDNLFSLSNISKNILKKRNRQTRVARKKIKLAKRVVKILSLIPSIYLIGLSGSLSLGVGRDDDDIDLFIVCGKNSLWITRFMVNLLLMTLNLKRRPADKNIKDKICPNMFMEIGDLSLPDEEQDIYSAHELAFLKPLYQREAAYQLLINSNRWVKKYLPNAFIFHSKSDQIRQKGNFCISLLNNFSQKIQLFYMRKKITNEVIKKNYVRFHPKDARSWIIPAYNKLVHQYL